jgi:hypothetical protein
MHFKVAMDGQDVLYGQPYGYPNQEARERTTCPNVR